jgi:N-formylglutamate deformylase
MFLSERTVAPYQYRRGHSALIVSMPHVGTFIPHGVGRALSDCAARRPDTDWHLPRLYDFINELGASRLVARYTRFAVDLNRPPDDAPLYATATTGLHPDILFDGIPAFEDGSKPTPDECAGFLGEVWHPYHRKLREELDRIKAIHGYAILFDAHSIRGVVPRLFEGELPDFNLGTADGRSADRGLGASVARVLGSETRYRLAVNGRFKGGYITRHYGDPAANVHALQLELAQRTYMRESAPYDYRPELADQVRPVLRRFVEAMLAWRPS